MAEYLGEIIGCLGAANWALIWGPKVAVVGVIDDIVVGIGKVNTLTGIGWSKN